jgi:hypothetical protein
MPPDDAVAGGLPGPIPQIAVTAWRGLRPWRDDRQVEQDMYLSRAAIAIGNHDALADTLAWRGGTCLHKLRLDRPRRYSEDLDYVKVGGPLEYGWVFDALREAADVAEMRMVGRERSDTRIKVSFAARSNFGVNIKVKVEINVKEIDAPRWWSGAGQVLTYHPAELIGTKFRALAQRSKGRDLWDVDLSYRELSLDNETLATCALHYLQHEGISPLVFRAHLARNIDTPDFRSDLGPLLAGADYDYDYDYDAIVVGHDLILWSDRYLDPLWEAGLSETARKKRVRDRAAIGLSPGLIQCPRHTNASPLYMRCHGVFAPGGQCPRH